MMIVSILTVKYRSFVYLLFHINDILIASKSKAEIEKLKVQLKKQICDEIF